MNVFNMHVALGAAGALTLLSTIHAMSSHFDIVHYHCLGPALFSFLPRLAGKKTVVTVQGLDWQRKKWGWMATRILRWGEAAAVSLPSATMVVSRTLQQHYRNQHNSETIYVLRTVFTGKELPASD
jgi:hypothetical protein